MAKQKNLWTEEQLSLARTLIERGTSVDEFLAKVGHSRGAYHSRIQASKAKERSLRAAADPQQEIVRPRSIPPEVVEDAQRRAMAPRTITAMLCGDPPPGYSALDRKAGA